MAAGVRFRLDIEDRAGNVSTTSRTLAVNGRQPITDLKVFLRAVHQDIVRVWREVLLPGGALSIYRGLWNG